MENKKLALSGIQPTGIFTLGNYIGAVGSWEKMQQEYDCIYFIADMHSLTTIRDREYLKNLTLKVLALLLACGLDVKRNILFIQSHVHAHAELAWVLQCNAQFGELKRMTQFKDKSLKHKDNINAGLFCYPALMAADILLYNADVVPIGIDQKQHLELTKIIATRFNNMYGETFKIPQPYIPEVGAKIMSLLNPTKKMSKSDENVNSFISMLDPPETIMNKFKRAVTDSDSDIKFSSEKPGISNLITIYSYFSNISIPEVEEKFKDKSYKDFKFAVGEIVANSLSPIQERYNAILKDEHYLKNLCEEGAKRASKIANNTLKSVYNKIGFI